MNRPDWENLRNQLARTLREAKLNHLGATRLLRDVQITAAGMYGLMAIEKFSEGDTVGGEAELTRRAEELAAATITQITIEGMELDLTEKLGGG